MAVPAPDPGTIIYLKDWLTIGALLLGPVFAVGWTLWHQDSKERHAAKMRLFIQLMAHRKSIPISQNWAQTLNVIDVVFADSPKVVAKWHLLYAVMDTKPQMNMQAFQHASLELMSEMAKELGYKEIQQTDIDKFYVPDQHAKEATRKYRIEMQLLRVLRRSRSFLDERPDAEVDAEIAQERKEDGQ